MTRFRERIKNLLQIANTGVWTAELLDATAGSDCTGVETRLSIYGLPKTGKDMDRSSVVGASFVHVATSRM